MTLIIAEAGVNHNGNLALAKKLIETASQCGADVVKFQTFRAELLATKKAARAKYQIENIGKDGSQISMLKKLELKQEDYKSLLKYSKDKDIEFLSTAFDDKSIEFLDKLGIKRWKIPSGEITNLPYLRAIAKKNMPVILSTGMADMGDIRDAIEAMENSGLSRTSITVLQCTTEYPAPYDEINLNAMKTIKDEFDVKIGYSDHTEGIEVAIAAVALGASVIEKHLTLSKQMEGPDHKASIEPEQFREMIKSIRIVERSLGNGIKIPGQSETKNMLIARKSIVAASQIRRGDIISERNLTTKRPGSGISPMEWDRLIGTLAQKDYEPDDQIEE